MVKKQKEYEVEIYLEGRVKFKRKAPDTFKASAGVLGDIMLAIENIKGWQGHDFSNVDCSEVEKL